MRAWSLACVAILVSGLAGCGYNSLQKQDEDVKATWSQLTNQYQRRADLILNLVKTVKGCANQEQQVLIGVTETRAKAAGSIQLTPELLNDPAVFGKFQAVQGQLSTALRSLFAVAEGCPDLKSDENFRDLQSQLEGTERGIAVARQQYIDAVRGFNAAVRSFPTNLTAKLFDFQVKPNFTGTDEQAIAAPPTVNFGQPPPAEAAPAASQPPGTGPGAR